MKPRPLPSGHQHGAPFIFAKDWTPEQALAVFELLDDLCQRIWDHYQISIQTLLREQRQIHPNNDSQSDHIPDPPF